MGWEPRQGGVYYYSATRENGRVRHRYLGRGEAARAAAALDSEARDRRRAEAEAVRSLRERLATPDAAMAALDAACDLALEAAIVSAGFHRRNYSAWRRRRSSRPAPTGRTIPHGGDEVMFKKAVPAEAARAAEDEIKLLLERARSGDVRALPALRETLDTNPDLATSLADLPAHVRSVWLSLIAGQDLALKESLGRKAAVMLDELAGPGSPALERLLAERVVASWLQVNHADAMAARADVPLKQAAFAQARLDSAHRRHLAAIGALATLRRLMPAATEVTPVPMAALPGA